MIIDNVKEVLEDYKRFTNHYLEELNIQSEGDEYRALVEFLIQLKRDLRLYLVKTETLMSDIWTLIRENELVFDYFMELCIHMNFLWHGQLQALRERITSSLALYQFDSVIDVDTNDRLLDKNEAATLLENNKWFVHLVLLKQVPLNDLLSSKEKG